MVESGKISVEELRGIMEGTDVSYGGRGIDCEKETVGLKKKERWDRSGK